MSDPIDAPPLDNSPAEANDVATSTLADAMDADLAIFEENPNAEFVDPADKPAEEPEKAPEKPVEEPEPKSEPETPEEEPKASEPSSEPDDFDRETEQKLEEMKSDPHPGLKFSELRRELKDYKQKIADLESGSVASAEVEQLKLRAESVDKLEEEVKELRSSLALNDYKRTDEYDTLIRKPMGEIEVLSSTIEKEAGLPEGSVLNAVKQPDVAIKRRMIEQLAEESDLSTWDQTRIYNMADRHIQISATDASLKDSAETRLQELSEMQVSQHSAANERYTQELKQGVTGAFDRYEGRLPGFVTEDGLPTEEYTQLKAQAAQSQINNVEDASIAIMSATILPKVIQMNKELSAQIQEKNQLLARYGGGTPAAAKTAAPAEAAPKKKTPSTFTEAMEDFDWS